MSFKYAVPPTNTLGRDAAMLALNTLARGLKIRGYANHDAVVDFQFARDHSTQSHLVEYLPFTGTIDTADKADLFAEALRLAAKAHRADGTYAHKAADGASADITAGKLAAGPLVTTVSGADGNGNLTITPTLAGNGWRYKILSASGVSTALAVVVDTVNQEIDITPGTDSSSMQNSSAAQLVTAWNTAGANVYATIAASGTGASLHGTGTGFVTMRYDTKAARYAILNQVKAFLNAHHLQVASHNTNINSGSLVTSSNATDDASALTLANELAADWAFHVLGAAYEFTTGRI